MISRRKKYNILSIILILIALSGLVITSIFLKRELNIGTLKIKYVKETDKLLHTNIIYINSNHQTLNDIINKEIENENDSFLEKSVNKDDYLNITIKDNQIQDIYSFEISCKKRLNNIEESKTYLVYYDSKNKKVISFNELDKDKTKIKVKKTKSKNPIISLESSITKAIYTEINPKKKKYVAITFDDGPSNETTTKLVDGLKLRNAKVTFFMLGNRILTNQELVKRINNEGHIVASHTYSHKNLLKINLQSALNDINSTNEVIKSVIGKYPKYIRPPYGNYNKALLDNVDMTFILWNVDTEDWKKRNSEEIYEYIINKVEDGDIVLLHDLYDTSVDGVLKAIDYLKDEGYIFVNLDELAKIKGINIETHKSYRSFK